MTRCCTEHAASDDACGVVPMTEQLITEQCKKNGGYTTPELNETLYLHYFGFSHLNGLGAFVGCTVLYLNNNALRCLDGLAPLVHLHSLYLASNALTSLSSLPVLPALRTLDVAHNSLTELVGLDAAVPQLQQLLASHNRLADATGLAGCADMLSLDLSHNALDDEAAVSAALQPLRASVRTLLLQGNTLCRGAAHYRERWVAAFTALRWLDEYPVFDDERERVEAFARGGAAAVVEMRRAQKARHAAEAQARFEYFSDFREASRDARRRGAPPPGPTAYYRAHAVAAVKDNGDDNDDDDAGDVYIPAAAVAAPSAHVDPMRSNA